MKVLAFDCDGYTRMHSRNSLIYTGPKCAPNPVPLVVAGQTWPVGTRFVHLGSRHTSAVFEAMSFSEPLVYAGMFRDDDYASDVALFTQGGKDVFFGYANVGDELVFGTEIRSARVIEMNQVEWLDESGRLMKNYEGPRAHGSGPASRRAAQDEEAVA